MNRQIKIFMAGVFVIAPLAITLYVIWSLATWVAGLGGDALHRLGLAEAFGDNKEYIAPILGAAAVLVMTYLVGLLSHLWLFRAMLRRIELLLTRVPGVKTIYESVRDLLNLFGGDPGKMGRAVVYTPPGSDFAVLGILTNEHPAVNTATQDQRVAIYLPFSYMFGGPTIYVSPRFVKDAGITVEEALKLCATAHVSHPEAHAGTQTSESKKQA